MYDLEIFEIIEKRLARRKYLQDWRAKNPEKVKEYRRRCREANKPDPGGSVAR